MKTPGWSEEDGQVVLRMSMPDYESLLFALGIASASGSRQRLRDFLALANRINAGNPHWTPYDLPDAGALGASSSYYVAECPTCDTRVESASREFRCPHCGCEFACDWDGRESVSKKGKP